MKTFIHLRFLILYLGFLFLILPSAELIAQTDSTKVTITSDLRTEKRLPILNNFRFIPSGIIPDPFITTLIAINVGSGVALDLTSYLKNFDGTIRDTASGDLTYISANIQFQYAVNSWLAFNVGGGGFGRLGTNTYTILTQGVSYATGFAVGGKAKLWQNDKMFLSTILEYKFQNIFLYSIYDFVKEAVENGGIDSTSSLLSEDNVSTTLLSVNYAYAPTDWCGVLAGLGFGLGQAFETKTKGNIIIATAFSVDFDNVDAIEFPIGILASVKYNSFGDGGANTSNIFTYGFKIAYTGHKDFDIGIENTYQNLSYKQSDEKIKTILTSFTLRYYF